MITKTQFIIGIISICLFNLLCTIINSEKTAAYIELHSIHPRYGNIIEASNNQYENSSNPIRSLIKDINFNCAPWDSC